MALATLADAWVQGVAISAACPAFFSNRSCSSGIGRFWSPSGFGAASPGETDGRL